MSLTIAAIQDEPRPGDVEHNLTAAATWIHRAADAGAEVVLFAETFLTGYDDRVFAGALPGHDDHAWLDPVRSAVDATGVVAIVNAALRTGERATISDLVVDRDGVRTVYDKQHLYASERAFFTPGPGGTSILVDDAELALSVCYDANFPEHAAAAAGSASVLAYLNSGAYFPGGEHRRDLHYAARALDNGMYVVFAGLTGTPHRFIGGSAIYDPLGRAVVRLGEEVGMAVASLDPDLVAEARDGQRMWADRRTGLGERRRVVAAVDRSVGGAV